MLLGGYPRASAASEARYRIDAPIAPAPATRVFALDDGAAQVVHRVSLRGWANARFLICTSIPAADSSVPELLLRSIGGSPVLLGEVMRDATAVVTVATDDSAAPCASILGRECAVGGIMTAGLVLAGGSRGETVTAALRPYSRVLLPSASEDDVVDLLSALRA